MGPIPSETDAMRVSCPITSPVSVTDYVRFRFGKWERVRSHCRSLPSR